MLLHEIGNSRVLWIDDTDNKYKNLHRYIYHCSVTRVVHNDINNINIRDTDDWCLQHIKLPLETDPLLSTS